MATTTPSPLTGYLRRLAHSVSTEGADGHLLERFAAHRDESAFRALVRRHGPMVLGVCRRVLGHEQDAEDAFQATFLVLAQKAGSLRRPDALAPWLYGVACRVARKARTARGRRRLAPLEGDPLAAPTADPLWADVRAVLDEAIQRLPATYRVPVVLCYLEGKTNAEAGRVLGLPRNTVATRLARARARLRKQLTHRGVTLSVSALALALAREAGAAAVPVSLAASAVRKATGAEAVSHPITLLTEGVVNPMSWMKWKSAAVLVLTLAGLAVGLGLAKGPRTEAPPPPRAKADAPAQPLRAAPLPKTERARAYVIDLVLKEKKGDEWDVLSRPTVRTEEDREAVVQVGKGIPLSWGDTVRFIDCGVSAKVRVKSRKDGKADVDLTAGYARRVPEEGEGTTFRTDSVRRIAAVALGSPFTYEWKTDDRTFQVTATVKEKADVEIRREPASKPSPKEPLVKKIAHPWDEDDVFNFYVGFTR
jgi:RNA polymerase sigma factor (sigma-70 family)